MENTRRLLPNPQQLEYNSLPPTTSLTAQTQSTSTRPKWQRHDEKEWDAIRDIVIQHYHTHKLADIIELVRVRTGFKAGVRQFKNKIAEWGLTKNLRKEQMEIILAKQEKRKHDQGRDTVWIINGAKLDDSRLQHFGKRTSRNLSDKVSPSAPTPDGVEYYTPIALSPHKSLGVDGVATATSALDLFRSNIERYDQNSRPAIVVNVENLSYLGAIRDKPRLTHPFHQWGEAAAVGSGRFVDKDKLSELLCQSYSVAKSLHAAWKDPYLLPSADLPHGSYSLTESPSYWTESQPPYDKPGPSSNRILKLVKQGSFFQSMMGFHMHERARWLGQWVQMDENVRGATMTASNHLFGRVSQSYPDTNFFSLLVNFHTTGIARNTLLLRLIIGEDPKGYVQNCDYCFSRFFILDIMGPEGAVKIHLSLRHDGLADADSFPSLNDLKARATLRFRRIHTKWSELAYLFQGWSEAKVKRRCTCGEIHDKTTPSGHMVDMFKEEMSKDQWDPDAAAFQGTVYQPYPLEARQYVVENPDPNREDSDTEMWDPEGTKGAEVFEPHPEAHDFSYDASR